MKKPEAGDFFFDAHCHLFNFNNIPLSSILERYAKSMRIGDLKTLFEILAITKLDRIINLFKTYELEIEHIVSHIHEAIMSVPALRKKIKIILPLIMDFEGVNPDEKLADQAAYLKQGVKKYFREHRTGNFHVFPFLGIDPGHFKTPARLLAFLRESFHELLTKKTLANGDFIGIKLYPPLGFDPAPARRNLTDALFDFCLKHDIPVTCHCSDLGFNTDPDFKKKTDPGKWRAVLEKARFNDLRLNLAHVGGKVEPHHARGWSSTIFELMGTYPHVYTDISFIADSRHEMGKLRQALDAGQNDVSGKILFGTDFSIVLMKTDSLGKYLKDAMKNLGAPAFVKYSSINVAAFLGPTIMGKMPFAYPLPGKKNRRGPVGAPRRTRRARRKRR